ncbi:MAG: hypothetical protein EBR82_88605 [Caulobacteraceae bacterium]|nr:hypothetical protein [Caulobacteraceae bacterium]
MSDNILTKDGRSVSHEQISTANFRANNASHYLHTAYFSDTSKAFFLAQAMQELTAAATALGYELRPLPGGQTGGQE